MNDISLSISVFEELSKLFEKTKAVINRQSLTTPRFYIRYLVELEDFVTEQWEDRDARQTMSKVNSKGLTALRQKLRKYNKDFELDIDEYRKEPDPIGYSSGEAAPDDDDDDDADELDDDDDDDTKIIDKKAPKHIARAIDSDEEAWLSDGSDSSASILSDIETKQMEDLRKFFLK